MLNTPDKKKLPFTASWTPNATQGIKVASRLGMKLLEFAVVIVFYVLVIAGIVMALKH